MFSKRLDCIISALLKKVLSLRFSRVFSSAFELTSEKVTLLAPF